VKYIGEENKVQRTGGKIRDNQNYYVWTELVYVWTPWAAHFRIHH